MIASEDRYRVDCLMPGRIHAIDALRTFCNFLIVFVHVSAIKLVNDANSLDMQTVNFICNKFAWSAMPVLFIVSGYLLMRNYSFPVWKSKLKKRMNTLIVPYLAWNLLYVALLSALSIIENGDLLWPMWKALFKVFGIATQPADTPLWYVRSLLVWLLLVPILQLLLKARWVGGCAICAMVVCLSSSVGEQLRIIFPLYSVLAFYLGGVLAVKNINFDTHLREWKYLYVLAGLIGYAPSPKCLNEVFIFMRGLLLLGLFSMVLDSAISKLMKTQHYTHIVQSAFFVYAAHRIICWKLETLWRFLLGETNILDYRCMGVLLTFVDAFTVILSSIILYKLLNKLLPSVGRVLSRH